MNIQILSFLAIPLFALSALAAPGAGKSNPTATEYRPTHQKFLELGMNQMISGGLVGGGMQSTLNFNTAGGSANFSIAAEGAFRLTEQFQISVPLQLFASSTTGFSLAVGPQYNFGADHLMNQFFVNLRPGFLVLGGGTSFILNATFGKRFELLPSVAYRPNFGMTLLASAGEMDFSISPFAISIEL
jgi:hypothetical protein